MALDEIGKLKKHLTIHYYIIHGKLYHVNTIEL